MDIAIVGAGPAGLMAAATAAQAGVSVELLDGADWAGGRLALQTQPLQGPSSIYGGVSGVDFCARLADDAVSAGVGLRLGCEVGEVRALDQVTSGYELALSGGGGDERLRARVVVLATGSVEPWLDAPGLTLRGAALSGEVQARLNRDGVRPGRRVVMAGSDNAGLLIAANLLDAGVEVAAVVDESPRVVGREFNAAPLRDAGVEMLTSTRVVEAHGEERVEAVTVDTDGQRRVIEADCLCMAGPRIPGRASWRRGSACPRSMCRCWEARRRRTTGGWPRRSRACSCVATARGWRTARCRWRAGGWRVLRRQLT